jgi:hypothetical protein
VAAGFSAALVVAVLITGFIVLQVPDEIGVQVLGTTWAVAMTVMLPYTLFIAGVMASAGSFVGLRALGEARESLRVGVIRSALSFAGAVVGAAAGGAPAAALGMAGGQWLGSAETWRAFLGAARRHMDGLIPAAGPDSGRVMPTN